MTNPPDASSHAEQRARLLVETARQLGGSLEPDAIFERLKKSVCSAMPCDGLIVSAYDRDAGLIRCDYAWVEGNLIDPASLPPLVYKPDSPKGMQTQVIRTGRPAIFSDVVERAQDPKGTYYEVDAQGGVHNLRGGGAPKSRSAIMVPLRLEDVVVGVVQVMADRDGAYDMGDLELLEGISLLLAVALENARLYRRAQDELLERRHLEEALREADRRKDEFLATLGHELRNPLNPIRNAVTLLRLKSTADPEADWGHGIIDRQVEHLTRLIDDLLDVSRITRGRLDLRRRPVRLDEIVRSAVESSRALVDSRGHHLAVDMPLDPILVDADPVRLAQVFWNLIENAAKYTPERGHIGIAASRRDGQVVVTVSDDGLGIAEDKLPHLFDLFYQADRSIERTTGGLGIGLTIVKRLVELHGGSVAAASGGAGRGSTFSVTLPLYAGPASTPRDGSSATAGRPLTSWRVLVADDNPDSANSMARLLRLAGNEVEVAFDGEQAVLTGDRQRPDVLILDIGMPKRNGYDVARWVREQPWGRDALLIAATGWGQDQDRRDALAAGFDEHLVKPVDLNALGRLLDRRAQGDHRH
jgi:signal transduction histidine kinase/CheY-like chemotaxis protein